mgnify:CR=1 FL=1
MKTLNSMQISLLVSALAGMGTITGKAFADKKIDITDFPLVFPFLAEVQKLGQIKWNEIPSNFSEMTPEVAEELKNQFAAEFDIPQDELESKIEQGLALVIEQLKLIEREVELVQKFITLFSSFK